MLDVSRERPHWTPFFRVVRHRHHKCEMLFQRLRDNLRFAGHQIDSNFLHHFHCRRIYIHRLDRCAFCFDFSSCHLLQKSLSHLTPAGVPRGKEKYFGFTSHASLPRPQPKSVRSRASITQTPYEFLRALAPNLLPPVFCSASAAFLRFCKGIGETSLPTAHPPRNRLTSLLRFCVTSFFV